MLLSFRTEGHRKPGFFALVLLGLLFAGGVAMPRAAVAQSCQQSTASSAASLVQQLKDNLESIALFKQIVTLNQWLNDAFSAFRDRMNDLLSLDIVMNFITNWMKAKQAALQHEETLQAEASMTEQAGVAAITAEHLRSSEPITYNDCIHAALRSGLASLNPMQGEIEDAFRKIIASKFRGPDVNMSNALASLAFAEGCNPNAYPTTGKAMSAWHAQPYVHSADQPTCSDPGGKGAELQNDVFSNKVAKMWEEEKVTIDGKTRYLPVPTDDSRLTWFRLVASYHADGNMVPNASGAAQSTPAGLGARMQWTHCQTLASAYYEPVAAFFARRTQPLCAGGKDPNGHFNFACAFSQAVCEFLQKENGGAGIKISADSPYFKGCLEASPVISVFEIEYASHLICLRAENAQASAAAGTKPGMISIVSDVCAGGWSAWQTQLAAERTAAILGLQGLMELKAQGCYPDTKPDPTIKSTADAGDAMHEPAKTKARAQKTVVEEDKLSPMPVKLRKKLPSGVPVAADEIDLPAVVAQ